VLALLGKALWDNGQTREAVRVFQDALEADPDEPDAWQGLGTAYLALGKLNLATEALGIAARLNALRPSNDTNRAREKPETPVRRPSTP
jgi:Flp pilus assembly protein TadD